MTPDRYQRVMELFQEAADCRPELRKLFLDYYCTDPELRSEVEAMLAADAQAGDLLDRGAHDLAAGVVASLQSPPAVGKRMGDYELLAPLATGGMGAVYLAEDHRLGRKVALKLLAQSSAADPALVRRFEREARVIAALDHPNIVRIYGSGQFGTTHFLATEYVEGQSLRVLLEQGPMEPRAAAWIAVQIAAAMAAAHSAGIVHRDIKPENVIVRADGVVKTLDFGIAKLTERATEMGLQRTTSGGKTLAGTIVGTPCYMSPEQARGGDVDARSDIFSFGSVLYEMLSGKPAFLGRHVGEVIKAILEYDPPPIETVQRRVPRPLAWVTAHSLLKDREARYQSASKLQSDLERVNKAMEDGKI